MRLEKHTDDEIRMAKEQSAPSIPPSKDELEEWNIVHKKMNADLARKADEQLGSQIISLQGVILPKLKGHALALAQSNGCSTVMELMYNPASGHHFPWKGSGLTGYEYIDEKALKGLELQRRTVLCQFMAKLITIDKGDNDKLEYWVTRMAAAFTKLADADKIEYGILAPFMALPLADLDAESAGNAALRIAMESGARLEPGTLAKIQAIKDAKSKENSTRRLLLLVYPYTHLEREELNTWLGNEAFVEEGDIGSDDWTGLPDV